MEINKTYTENCIDTMSRMSNEFVDLVVTSPPYDNLRDYKGFDFDFESIAKELYRIIKPGGVVVWVVGDSTIKGSESGTSFKQALFFKDVCGFSLYDTMIYQKIGNPSPQRPEIRYGNCFEYMFVFCKGRKPKSINLINKRNKDRKETIETRGKVQKNGEMLRGKFKVRLESPLPNVWLIDATNGARESSGLHPAAFPEIIPKRHIYTWSEKGDLVYDPFMGSGTTAKQAHLLKRDWIGSEVSQEYVAKSNKRLEKYLTQTTLF